MSLAALFAWALRHEVLVGWAVAVFGALALMGGVYAFGRHAGVAAEQPKAAEAQAQARTATAQAAVTATAAQAADRAGAHAARITAKAEEAAHDVQAATGATDALDPDLLSRWRSGLVGLRAEAAGADGAGGAEPAGAVPQP